ncbi:TonB-dependent receptor plug domain-containing protein [Flavobacterium selenitireducens]|uniref:TonB-dependent receptor plug domain-containing protein n=1 Tax=Flavobacterium selenitireducens TaxID=2722704 RepID=UPI00168ADAD6|nr:TonB-dependent receptor [Flavobacterium selenitireducens]MBD3582826.1 TonB-dependent receptor [Flavobacterium selenitireducens]
MTAKKLLSICFLFLGPMLWAQQDSIALCEVVVGDAQLRKFSDTQHIIVLNDSVLGRNQGSLAALLQFNSSVYLKENGFGSGVASASFRGTTAQQTAVVWNGININSQVNGQTDFNTIATSGYDEISVRSGGGSVIYGSSAIGGSVHLSSEPIFGDHLRNTIEAVYGSFNTQRYRYKANFGSDKFAVNAIVYHNRSDNDYDFPNSTRKNRNGQFYNSGINVASAYKISDRNFIKYFGEVYDGERHFPLLTSSDTKTKYRDFNARNLVEWTNVGNRFTSRLKAAYLHERYGYFENLGTPATGFATVETLIGKYDFAYNVSDDILVNAIVDYTSATGRGSDISNHSRGIGSGALLFRHKISPKFHYEAGIRQEITENYDSPLLYSAGIRYRPFSFYSVKLNGSRNFRIPTFNDLYWGDGGNPNLKPESSYQVEIGNELKFGKTTIALTGYYMKIRDMIQWLPGTTSTWFPVNVNRVESYGAEIMLESRQNIGRHELLLNATYAYAVSENEKTQKQLIYVPFHKATANLSYGFRKFSAHVQSLFNGEVFTRSDNNKRYNLEAYAVVNAGICYDFGKSDVYRIGFQLRNALDSEYETMENRPYPGRHCNVTLTLQL